MLLLTSLTDKLQLVTSAIGTVDVHVDYVDNASGVITPANTDLAAISSATTTDVLVGASSTQRNIRTICVRNTHASVSQNVKLLHILAAGTAVELHRATLAAGEGIVWPTDGPPMQFLNSGAIKTGFDPNAVAITGGTISGVDLTVIAGTSSSAGLTTPSGTLTTAAAAGDWEYDGLAAYFSHLANARGVLDAEQFIFTPAGTFTLVSQTAAQKMFNSPTNGALTVNGATTYHFESLFDLTVLSATSGGFGWALLGTATFTAIKWHSTANKAVLATQAAPQDTVNVIASNTAICAASTATVGWAYIKGVMRINAGGTIIPAISQATASAAVVSAASFFRAWPVGTNAVASVGNWS